MNVFTTIGALIVALWVLGVTLGAALTVRDAVRLRLSERAMQRGIRRLERWVNRQPG